MHNATAPESATALVPGSPGMEAWKAFLRANALLLRELDEELRARHGFSLGDYDVLVHLAEVPGGRRRMCDLAGAVLLTPSGLSRRVERLERTGLVERQRAEADGRSIEAGLTPAGRRMLRRLRVTHRAGVEERFVAHFSSAELETMRQLLSRLTPAADSDAANAAA